MIRDLVRKPLFFAHHKLVERMFLRGRKKRYEIPLELVRLLLDLTEPADLTNLERYMREVEALDEELDRAREQAERLVNSLCTHPELRPVVMDQTLGVLCPACGFSAGCWGVEHCSEYDWNKACKNDSKFNPSKQSRENVCFLCELKMTKPSGEAHDERD